MPTMDCAVHCWYNFCPDCGTSRNGPDHKRHLDYIQVQFFLCTMPGACATQSNRSEKAAVTMGM